MMRVVLLGAGHIGHTIASLLSNTGDYQVKVVDRSAEALSTLKNLKVETSVVDTADGAALLAALKGYDAVINAALPPGHHGRHAGAGRRLPLL